MRRYIGCMIWFFERQRDRLHYEIRRQPDGPDYELVVTHPDGRQEVERFSDSGALLDRSSVLQHTLTAEGWEPPIARFDSRGGRRVW
jgi:hypothetical protein